MAIVVLAAMGGTGNASAAIHLDRGFGRNGRVLLPGKSTAHQTNQKAVAIEPDGGLVLATNRTLQRLRQSGHLDRSFGNDGTVTPPAVAGGRLAIMAAAVDSQGRIVVVGTSRPPQPQGGELPLHVNALSQPYKPAHTAARVLRYLPNGKLDPTFGEGGIVETDFGLPTPEAEGVRLAAKAVVEVTGVAVDRAGRIVITGGAAEGVTSGCFHDDFNASISYASFAARLTEAGSLDTSFNGDGVFGGRSTSENPLRMEDAGEPVITPNDGVIFQRGGWGHCARQAGGLGFVQVTPDGSVFDASAPKAPHRVLDATATSDGSVVLLLGPAKGRNTPEVVEKLRTDGSVDSSFGNAGQSVLRLPGESYASRVRVAPSGEVLVQGVKVPPLHRRESEEHWWSRFSNLLIGLTADGARDPRFGPHGVLTTHIPYYYEDDGFWLDAEGRPAVTTHCRSEGGGPTKLAAIRFTFEG